MSGRSFGLDEDMLVIGYLSDGLTEKEVAETMGATVRYIHFRIERRRRLMGAKNTTNMVAIALRAMWESGRIWKRGGGWSRRD